jgi:hypothetical protein
MRVKGSRRGLRGREYSAVLQCLGRRFVARALASVNGTAHLRGVLPERTAAILSTGLCSSLLRRLCSPLLFAVSNGGSLFAVVGTDLSAPQQCCWKEAEGVSTQ